MDTDSSRRRLILAGTLASLSAATRPSWSSVEFPNQAIKLIVPFGAGGATDIGARAFGKPYGEALGVPLVIENRAGAGGTIGTTVAARSAPDGYTLILATNATFALVQQTYPQLAYDAQTDFEPIGLISSTPEILAVSSKLGVGTLKEFIATGKTRKGTSALNFGSPGKGSTPHFAAELFKARYGVDFMHVPYKSGAEMLSALMSDEVQFCFGFPAELAHHVKAGRMRAIGLASRERTVVLPEVPTMLESGLGEFVVQAWSGVSAPKHTQGKALDTLHAALQRVLRDQAFRSQNQAFGIETAQPGSKREDFLAFVAAEARKWKSVAESAGIRPE
ncbi:MAG: Bug family tripartite tricarboxylate transporter substrate binding protein [Hyphomicrobiaceae bacterium]